MSHCALYPFHIPRSTVHWYGNRGNMYKTVQITCFTMFHKSVLPDCIRVQNASILKRWFGWFGMYFVTKPSVCWIVSELFFWGYKPQDQTTVFFAAARKPGADREAAAKQLKIFLPYRVPALEHAVTPCKKTSKNLVALFKKEKTGSPSLDGRAFSAGQVFVWDLGAEGHSCQSHWRCLAQSWSDVRGC